MNSHARPAIPAPRTQRENLTLLAGFDPSLDRLGEFEGDLPVPGFQRLEQLSIPLAQVTAAAFAHPVHRVVAAWWATARDRRQGVPRSGDFDPVDVSAALGSLMLLELVDGGADFRYRVYGSRIAERSKFDWTGRRVGELHEPARSTFLFQYRAVCTLRVVLYAEHDAPARISQIVRWCRLVLPLTDAQDNIDRLLVANVAVTRRD